MFGVLSLPLKILGRFFLSVGESQWYSSFLKSADEVRAQRPSMMILVELYLFLRKTVPVSLSGERGQGPGWGWVKVKTSPWEGTCFPHFSSTAPAICKDPPGLDGSPRREGEGRFQAAAPHGGGKGDSGPGETYSSNFHVRISCFLKQL